MRIYAYDDERGTNPHAVQIELSIEDAQKINDIRERENLGRWEIGEYVVVTDLDTDLLWRVASAPCGELCHCAAVAFLADFHGIVVGEDGAGAFAGEIAAADFRTVRKEGDTLWFNPPLAAHDSTDLGDDALYILHSDTNGNAVSVYAPLCGHVGELERRVVRCFGLDVTIDDHGESAMQTGGI